MKVNETEIIVIAGGNGSTVSEAVEICGAESFKSGIDAIIDYIENVFIMKDVISIEGVDIVFWDKTIHRIDVITKQGATRSIFFNTTDIHSKINYNDADIIKEFYRNGN